MKTRLAVLASCLALGIAVGLNGCASDRGTVQLQAICVPTDDCTFTAECDAQYIGYPTLDIAQSRYLWLFLQVNNQLPDNANTQIGRVNTNDAHVDEAVVDYEGAAGGTQYIGSNFWIPANGTGVISLKLNLTTATVGEVLARVRLRGYYDGGTRFETGEFPITVKVCSGGTCAPAACGTGATCPPSSEGQRPLACVKAA